MDAARARERIRRWAIVSTPLIAFGAYALLLSVSVTRPRAERWLLENGPAENATFAVFLWAAIRGGLVSRARWSMGSYWPAAFFLAFAAASTVVAMEEISWGQQVVHYATPEWVRRLNVQDEMTLHNVRGHNSASDLALLGLAGVVGVGARAWHVLRPVAPSPVLLSWFLVIAIFGAVDVFNDSVPLGPTIDEVIEWIGEFVELLGGISAVLFIEMKASEGRRTLP